MQNTDTRPIYRLRPVERLRYVRDELLGGDSPLNRQGGVWSLSVLAVVTYEPVRGSSAPRTLACRIVGIADDVAAMRESLVVLDVTTAQLVTIPLPTLVSIEVAA